MMPISPTKLISSVNFTTLIAVVFLAFILALPSPSRAGESGSGSLGEGLKDLWNRDRLTGEWDGLRPRLHDRGIDIGLRLSQYGQDVASGGVHKNVEYGGTMDYRVTADLSKLVGSWEGLSVIMHARTRFGADILADAGPFTLPNAGLLMPAPGNYSDSDVTGLIVSQTFPVADEHLGLAAVGMLDIIDTVSLVRIRAIRSPLRCSAPTSESSGVSRCDVTGEPKKYR